MGVVWKIDCENCGTSRSYTCGYGMLDYDEEGRKILLKSMQKEKKGNPPKEKRHELYYCPNCKKLSFRSVPFPPEYPDGVVKIKHCRDCKGEMLPYQGEPYLCRKCGHLNGREGVFLVPSALWD